MEFAVLNDVQQFGLEEQRQVADFIQKQCPAFCHLDTPDTPLVRPCERTLLVPEQFGFEQFARQGWATHRHKWFLGPPAGPMNHPRQQALAHAAFASDEHGRIQRGDAGHGGQQFPRGHGGSRETGFRGRLRDSGAQLPVFLQRPSHAGGGRHERQQFIEIKGLRNVFQGSPLHRLHRVLYLTHGRDDDDRHIGVGLLQVFQHPEAVEFWHLQIHQCAGQVIACHFHRFPTIAR